MHIEHVLQQGQGCLRVAECAILAAEVAHEQPVQLGELIPPLHLLARLGVPQAVFVISEVFSTKSALGAPDESVVQLAAQRPPGHQHVTLCVVQR